MDRALFVQITGAHGGDLYDALVIAHGEAPSHANAPYQRDGRWHIDVKFRSDRLGAYVVCYADTIGKWRMGQISYMV